MSDDEVARLRAAGFSFRQIARALGMSLAGVQRALRRAGVVPGMPAAQVVDEREQVVRAYLSKLDDDDPQVRDLYMYRLAHVRSPMDFSKLCERLGRSGSFGQTVVAADSRP